MTDFLPVLRILGALITCYSLAMFLPWGFSVWNGDGLRHVWLGSLAIAFTGGMTLWFGLHRYKRELQPRHGIFLVACTWLLLPLIATLPLMWSLDAIGRPASFTLAYFESVSGLTTTGGTAFSGLDTLPTSINVWRTFQSWLGGMGILVLAVAILPLLGVGGTQLFKAEVAGPIRENKLTPRIKETAKGMWSLYALLSLLCFLGYWIGGMTASDAMIHMFTTVSLGGLSSHDASFAYFNSGMIETVAVAVMLVASCNFTLYFVAMRKGYWGDFWRDPEMRATVSTLLGSGIFVGLLLWVSGNYDLAESLRHGIFHTISVASTTGYTTLDYMQGWPAFAPIFMLLLSCVATSAGSTGCGIKMVRVLILMKQARREMTRLVHPHAVQPVRLGNRVVENREIFSILAFMLVYTGTVLGLSMLMMLSGLDPASSFGAILATVNCVGPGFGAVGPSGNYSNLSDFQVWVCTFAMVLGRLELLSFIALLTPSFWRK
ncbi:MAG: TrkH family potassium uptake protein [Gallionellaceae bacterium]|jgi:trk system potassium uptake protein TrkH|nr:TrkH family potassium uptake protein [Gallionellaceae bacterium]